MPVEVRRWITTAMVRSEPATLFVFGDNLAGWGRGGQAAVMRNEPNAVGVPTKNRPARDEAAFFSDDDFDVAKAAINAAMLRLAAHLRAGGLDV